MRLIILLLLLESYLAQVYLTDAMVKLAKKDKPPKKLRCNTFRGLRREQDKFCRDEKNAMYQIAQGYSQAIQECADKFAGNEQWQCSTKTVKNKSKGKKRNEMDITLNEANKESSFMNSMISTGAVYKITRACFEGQLGDCKCQPSGREPGLDRDEYWTRCNEHVDYGMRVTKKFYEHTVPHHHKPSSHELKEIIALHNRKVGRELVKQKMYKKCRCMGYSGSCSIKHCWISMPDVRVLTDETYDRYDGAVQITETNQHHLLNNAADLSSSLVYHHQNDYCMTSITTGRKCDPNKTGPGSCEYICCGKEPRKKTVIKQKSVPGTCSFTYEPCCSIKCEQEEVTETEYYCR